MATGTMPMVAGQAGLVTREVLTSRRAPGLMGLDDMIDGGRECHGIDGMTRLMRLHDPWKHRAQARCIRGM